MPQGTFLNTGAPEESSPGASSASASEAPATERMLGAPLGSVSDEKRLDGGRHGLRAFEESVVARAGNNDELTLWDRIGDRRR